MSMRLKLLLPVLASIGIITVRTLAANQAFSPAGPPASSHYRASKDQVLDFLASVAKENHSYIVFGTKRQQQDGACRNSSIVLDRGGKVARIYNKNFPTIGEIEDGIVPRGRSAGL